MRIVSLLPSATEIVAALGAAGELVGRSFECDYPAAVKALPVVMRPRTPIAGSSSEVDARVQSARRNDESLYVLDERALVDLRPDVLLTQDLCGVCSVTESEVEELCRRRGLATRIVSVSPVRLGDVAESFVTIGEAVGRSSEAQELRDRFVRLARPPERAGSSRPRVAVIEWLDPPIVAGLWAP